MRCGETVRHQRASLTDWSNIGSDRHARHRSRGIRAEGEKARGLSGRWEQACRWLRLRPTGTSGEPNLNGEACRRKRALRSRRRGSDQGQAARLDLGHVALVDQGISDELAHLGLQVRELGGHVSGCVQPVGNRGAVPRQELPVCAPFPGGGGCW